MICDIYDGLASMCLKDVLGAKSRQSRCCGMVIRCNINVKLIDLWPEMMFGGFNSCMHQDLLMKTLGAKMW